MAFRVSLAAVFALVLGQGFAPVWAGSVATAPVEPEGTGDVYAAEGFVEAVRQSVIASQVAGRITALPVKAGDTVKSGQLLARIDERAAAQQAIASQAQVAAARAQMEVSRKEYDRSRRLFQKQYISQAAMDQAEAQYKAAQAQARAMLAQAGVATTETSFHTLLAPYAGVLANVAAEVGDMATPGKPLMTLYEPTLLRVVVNLPESYVTSLKKGAPVTIELPGAGEDLRWQKAESVTLLPTADPTSHTVQVRLNLPAGRTRIAPGTFAKAHLPITEEGNGIRLLIPAKAVIKRTELYAVYVADADGRFRLRQVRLGKVVGSKVEILAGLRAGELVALDPLAAARQ